MKGSVLSIVQFFHPILITVVIDYAFYLFDAKEVTVVAAGIGKAVGAGGSALALVFLVTIIPVEVGFDNKVFIVFTSVNYRH